MTAAVWSPLARGTHLARFAADQPRAPARATAGQINPATEGDRKSASLPSGPPLFSLCIRHGQCFGLLSVLPEAASQQRTGRPANPWVRRATGSLR